MTKEEKEYKRDKKRYEKYCARVKRGFVKIWADYFKKLDKRITKMCKHTPKETQSKCIDVGYELLCKGE